jgi:lipase chaperone LimK
LFEALGTIRIDSNNDIVLDHDALIALNQTLNFGETPLSDRDLDILQDLIRVALPGKAGEQTAKTVADYYQYLQAERAFHKTYEAPEGMPSDLSSLEQQYEELQALRELYLGQDTADRLFATADAGAHFMLQAKKVEADPSLSPEQKEQKMQALNAQLMDKTVPVTNWSDRYSAFQIEKKRIAGAQLPEGEKQAQVDALMRRHFTNEELAKVRHLDIGRI